jgi:porin
MKRESNNTKGLYALVIAGVLLCLRPTALAQEQDDAGPIDDSETASINDELVYIPTTRPSQPPAQHPAPTTQGNTDQGKPPLYWQRVTDEWFGLRPKLEDKGITFQPSLELIAGHNVMGGDNTSSIDYAYLFNFNLTIDTEKLANWKGGTFFINLRTQDGADEEQDGAFQSASDVANTSVTEVTEGWYEQKLFDDKLRVKAGKVDANTEFAHPDNSGEFLNASMAVSPTILGIPQLTDTAFGANAFAYPCDHFHIGVGAYDGAHQEGFNVGANGPATLFGPPGDMFLISEADVTWTASQRRDGRLGVGYWYHTGDFHRFNGGVEKGTSGVYMTLDQMLWHENPGDDKDDQGIAAFLQYGYANPEVSLAEHHVGGGLTWTGAIPSRDDDQIGLGATWVGLTDANGANLSHDDELVIEGYYKIRALKWLSIKPDVQYVVNPVNGHGDSLELTLQIVADF